MEWLRKKWEFAGLVAVILGGLLKIFAPEKLANWGGWTGLTFAILVIGKFWYDRSPALQATLEKICKAAEAGPIPAEERPQAFRGLLPFRERDAAEFAKLGRQTDVAALLPALRDPALRVVVLRGESGCGKTSLISAGLLPILREEGWRIVNIEPETANPAGLIWSGDSTLPNQNLLIVADQFEEHFLRTLPEVSSNIGATLRRSIESKHGKWLVGVRADFKYLVDDLIEQYRGEFEAEFLKPRVGYGLHLFTIERAEKIISEIGNQVFDSGVALRLAQDLSRGGHVLPADIQFVGYEMQERNIQTLDDYRKAGGRDGIIADSIRHVIEQLPTEDRRTNARKLLTALIDQEHGTRLTEALTNEELGARAGIAGNVAAYCEPFVKQRLIVRVTDPSDKALARYRLPHDYLVQPIYTAIGRTETDYEKVIRLLTLYAGEYSRNPETRIPPHDYRLIRRLLRRVATDVRLADARRLATPVIRVTARRTWIQGGIVTVIALGLALFLPPVRYAIESSTTRGLNSRTRPTKSPQSQPQVLRLSGRDIIGVPAYLVRYGRTPFFKQIPIPETVVVPIPPSSGGEQPSSSPNTQQLEIGRFDVTVAQFNAFANASGGTEKPGDGDLPVVAVPWDDANNYCAWLNQITGRRFRLPTAAEWEAICRAGKTDTPSAGTLGDYAWDFENSGAARQPVGRRRPNILGIYDMLGNVEQWMADWDEDWSLRSTRGGNNTLNAQELSCKTSSDRSPRDPADVVGFRCIADAAH